MMVERKSAKAALEGSMTTARLPRETASRPRPVTIFTASRTVRRLTLKRAANSPSLGRLLPALEGRS